MEKLIQEYLDREYACHKMITLDEYNDWKEDYDTKSKFQSQFYKNCIKKQYHIYFISSMELTIYGINFGKRHKQVRIELCNITRKSEIYKTNTSTNISSSDRRSDINNGADAP